MLDTAPSGGNLRVRPTCDDVILLSGAISEKKGTATVFGSLPPIRVNDFEIELVHGQLRVEIISISKTQDQLLCGDRHTVLEACDGEK